MQKMKIIQAQQSSKSIRNPSVNGNNRSKEGQADEQEDDVLLTVPDDAAKPNRYYSEQSDFSLQSSD